ncbi:LapA family protein [Chitinivorax tropicus]|nr:lipopolysaccharide assembly protein LapA domain-containing protein [Chitinivorax tropicus]
MTVAYLQLYLYALLTRMAVYRVKCAVIQTCQRDLIVMRYFIWALQFVVFLLFLGFALHNSQTVSLRYFLGYEWQAPLILMLLVFFSIGAAFGLLAGLGQLLKLRREILVLKKELRSRGTLTQSGPQQPDVVI